MGVGSASDLHLTDTAGGHPAAHRSQVGDIGVAPHAGGTQVELLGEVWVGPTTAVAVESNTVYVGVGLRLVVLDLGGVQPVFLGATDVFSDMVSDVALSGSTAFVAAGAAGLGFAYHRRNFLL